MKKQFTELIGVCFTLVLLLIGSTGAQAQYCDAASTNTSDDWLAGVQFAGIDNPSGSTTYSDFTDQLGTVVPGVSYEFIGTIGNSGTWNQFLTVYIDFNQDEIFDEVTERFDLGNCAFDGCTIVGDILIPVDAVPGTTRMRVIERWNGFTTSSCVLGSGFGEVEDYSLLVGGDCTPPSFAYNIIDDCELFTYDVTATLNDFGGNSFVTVYLDRSDIGDAGFVTIPDFLVGQTIDIILDVPFGVVVTASIEGADPVCNSGRTWTEEGLCPPMNNECEMATELVCDETIDGTTINGSFAPEGVEFCNGFASPSAPAVWYEYTPETNALLTASVAVSFDAQHFVYSGSCDALECIDGSDFGPITWTAAAGETYYVMVTGWGTSTGDFSITLDCTPILCDYPDLTATMVDDNGDEITDCLPVGESYRVEVSLAAGDGNDSYTVTVGDSTKVMVSPETHIFGTYASGVNTNVTVIGDQDPLCGADAVVVSELCPPTNDDCASAQAIACGETLAGATLGANPLPVDFAWCNAFVSPNAPAVWYTVTPETNAFVTVGVDVNFDAQHMVFSGSCDELVCINGSDFGDITFPAVANDTYYVVVTGWSTGQGLFDITVTCDEILCEFPEVTATAVDDEGVEIDGCLDFGSTHRVEVSLANGSGNDSYTVTVGDSTVVMLSGETHIFGTYTVGNNISVAVVGDTDTDCNVNTSVIVPICPAENDLCENAFEAVCGGFYEGTTLGATSVLGQEYCVTSAPSADNGGVWYSFTLDSDAELDIDLSGSLYDTKLFLYTGTCDGLVCADGNDDGGDGLDSRIQGFFTAGDYYIYVTGFSGNRGTYVMNISCVDAACSPEVTAVASDSEGNPIEDCVDLNGEYYVLVTLTSGDVELNDFYNVSINGGDPVQIAAAGSGVVGPVAALDVANISVTGAEVNTCSGSATASVVICPPSNDMPCDAIALPNDGTTGTYTNVDATVDEGEITPTVSNCATSWCETTAQNTVWFTFVGPASGRAEVSLCGLTSTSNFFDSQVAIYSATDCNDYSTFELLGANDDAGFANCPDYSLVSIASACLEPGETYYVQVDGYFGAQSPFDITVTELDGAVCACELPDFGEEVFTFADTAPVCEGEDAPGFSLTFYSWEDMGSSTGFVYTYAWDGNGPFEVIMPEGAAPFTVPEIFPLGTVIAVTVDIDDVNCPGAPGSIYPLAGNVVQDEFACDEDCEGTPGGTVGPGSPCVIDDLPGSYNADCLCIPVPENDTCADAIPLFCDADVVTGTNVSATADLMCNGIERNSVWYTFTSDVAATVFMTTCHPETDYDTDISMFTGTCADDLVCFPGWGGGGYIDGNSGCEFTAWSSEGTFEAEAGVTYYIAVAGFAGLEGNFGITLTCEIDDAVTMTGTVDGWPATCGDREVDVDLYTPDTDVLVGSYAGIVDAAGNFTIADLAVGTYDVIVKIEGSLAQGFADYEIVAGDNALVMAALQRGDINGDNGINIIDFSLINASFNSLDGDENYNPLADLNCSGGVNILDVSILSPNFLATGATAPLD